MEFIPANRNLIDLTYSLRSHQLNIDEKPEEDPLRKQSTHDYVYLWKSGDFADAVINVNGVEFPVHRNILACCSEYFRALFMDKLQTSSMLTIKNREIRPNYFKCQNTATDATRKPRICFTSSKSQSSKPGYTEKEQSFYSSRGNPSNPKRDANIISFFNKTPLNINSLDTPPEGNKKCKEAEIGKKQPSFHVTIDYVTPTTMSQILEHAYGGCVKLENDNVEQLLTAADRFQITTLAHHCNEFLSKNICTDNCISIYKFSSMFFDCTQLKKVAFRFILDNFEDVCQKSTEFEHLTEAEFSGLLINDNLNVRREEIVLDAIFKWVLANPEHREETVATLVKYVRIGSFLPENVVSSFLYSSHLRECNPDNGRIVLKILESVTERQKELLSEGTDNSISFIPRLPRDLLFVIGGSNFGYPLGIVEVFDSRTWNWNNIGPNIVAPRSYHGTAYVNKEIYVVGGFDGQTYLSCCCKCCPDPDGDLITLENVTPMHSRRCYVGVVQLHDLIYAIGGFDGVYRLNSAERFDYRTNQWSFISPMSHHRSDAGVAVLDHKIYVCGGFSGTECIRTVEMYDPLTEEWSPQSSMPDAKSGLGLVSHDGCLYAVGGFNGIDSTVRLANMDCFNPGTGQWTALIPMTNPRSNLAVAVLEDVLYAIGGYNGERTSSVVECYDFKSQSWFQSTRLSQSRSALSVILISGLSNTATIVGRDYIEFIDGLEEGDDDELIVSSVTE